MDVEAELTLGTVAEIMFNEKHRPVTSTTGISSVGAQVAPTC